MKKRKKKKSVIGYVSRKESHRIYFWM